MKTLTSRVLFEATEDYGPLTIIQDYKSGDWGQLFTKGEEFIILIGSAKEIKSTYKKFRHNGYCSIYEPYDYRCKKTRRTFPKFDDDKIYGLCIDPNDSDDTLCVWNESAVIRFMAKSNFLN